MLNIYLIKDTKGEHFEQDCCPNWHGLLCPFSQSVEKLLVALIVELQLKMEHGRVEHDFLFLQFGINLVRHAASFHEEEFGQLFDLKNIWH